MLNLLKSSDKRISKPPTKEVTKRFFTLKTFLATLTEDWEDYWEQTTEPRCFLCNGAFPPNSETNKTLAIAIALGDYQNERITQYALFHECCLDTVWRLFEAFFQEFLYNHLFGEGRNTFVMKGYKSPFKILNLEKYTP